MLKCSYSYTHNTVPEIPLGNAAPRDVANYLHVLPLTLLFTSTSLTTPPGVTKQSCCSYKAAAGNIMASKYLLHLP